jgi:CRP/FNR family transcriptional regulator, cAMP and macrophage regulator
MTSSPEQLGVSMNSLMLDGHELVEWAGSRGVLRAEPGRLLLSEGEPVECVYLIQEGEVEVYRRRGGHRVVIQILRAGDLLGLDPHLCHAPLPFSARTLSPVTAVRLRGEVLTWLLETRPSLSRRFLVYLASYVERMQQRVEELASGDLKVRTATLLLNETDTGSDTVRLPQLTLAELLGASRSSVNRVLKDLEARGMLRIRYRRIEVLDRAGMRALAA